MKKCFLLLFSLFTYDHLFSQSSSSLPNSKDYIVGDIYGIKADFVVNGVNDDNNCNGDAKFIVYTYSRIRISQVNQDGSVKFILTQGYRKSESNPALINKVYCTNTKTLDGIVSVIFKSKIEPDYGLLTIPFKFQYDSYVMYPGGSLGGFFGLRFSKAKRNDRAFSLIGFGGISSVPQNNDNSTAVSTDIKVIPGLGAGVGGVYTIDKFQVGILTGWDLYRNNGRQTNSWLSLSVGVTLMKPKE